MDLVVQVLLVLAFCGFTGTAIREFIVCGLSLREKIFFLSLGVMAICVVYLSFKL